MDLLLAETYDKVYQRHLDMANYTQTLGKETLQHVPRTRLRIHNRQLHKQQRQRRQRHEPKTQPKKAT